MPERAAAASNGVVANGSADGKSHLSDPGSEQPAEKTARAGTTAGNEEPSGKISWYDRVVAWDLEEVMGFSFFKVSK